MKFLPQFVFCLAWATLLHAQAPAAPAPKVALVNIQQAIVASPAGQAAAQRLEAEFGPRKTKLDAEQKEIEGLQEQLKREDLKDEVRQSLTRQVDEKITALNHETDQDDADLDEAQKNVLQAVGPQVIATVVAYAKKHGFDMVFDISSSQAPLLYTSNATDITANVIAVYGTKPTAQHPQK